MMQYISEPGKIMPVSENYDVVVSGGGIAGVAAALAAVRQGKRVLLLERMFALGGLATLGLITIYLPLCDGKGRQVCFGIAEELLRLSIRYGYETDYPKTWLENQKEHGSERFLVRYNAQVFAILLEQLLREHSVDILYGTTVCNSVVKQGKIKALIIENKSGRSAVIAKTFVDATGDADICAMVGENTQQFVPGNALAAWYYETIHGKTSLKMVGASDVPSEDEAPVAVESSRISGLNAKEISNRMIESHQKSLELFLKKGNVSEEHSLATLATIPQLRMTRRLVGCTTLEETECTNLKDSIGMVGDWRKRGPVYEIPFHCLIGEQIANLIVAGRCISASDDMWDVTRVIPACALTGEAAGTAAAMTDDFHHIDIEKLQDQLRNQGVMLHEENLG